MGARVRMVWHCVAAGCYITMKEGMRLVWFPKTPNKDESGRNKSDKREIAGKLQVILLSFVVVILEQTALKMSQDCASI